MRGKGFTLIEVLIALALAAVILASVYAAFFYIVRGTKGSAEALDEYIETGRALERIGREIRSCYYREGNRFTFFEGGKKGESSQLKFTSASGAPSIGSGLASISYSVEETDEGGALVREAGDTYSEERFKAVAIADVAGFEASFRSARGWAKAWDSSLEKRPPDAVRIDVTLKDGRVLSAISEVMAR
ncbi:MAG: prepilin-type N-terminal cleavage/methylation domain-containing protein [Deltaproteobacteria bacterium]|nr:prepilin-type N-terminal cleavage/methylation domain-containing protein [Deltaproteobacteria bacterium]